MSLGIHGPPHHGGLTRGGGGVWLGSRRGGLRGLKRPSGMLTCLLCPLRPVRPPHLTRLGQRRGQACVCSVLGSGRSERGDASQGDGPPLVALAADHAPRLNAPTSHLLSVMHSRSGRHPGPGVWLPALHVWLPGLNVRPPDSLRVPPRGLHTASITTVLRNARSCFKKSTLAHR